MHGDAIRKGVGGLIATVAVLALSAGTARADEKELLKRLDAQAKQLEEQARQIEQLKKLFEGGGARNPYAQSEKEEKEKIDKRIDSYLKEKETKKKADDKIAAAAREAEGFEVGKHPTATGKFLHDYLWFESADKAFRIHVGGRLQVDAVSVTQDQRITGLNGPNSNATNPLSVGGIGKNDDAINFRRARLDVQGTFWEVFDFYCQYDFVNTQRFIPGSNINNATTPPSGLGTTNGTVADRGNVENIPAPTDMWLQLTKVPIVGNVRVGNQKPWIGFEHLTSSRYLDWMERSSAFDAFLENGNNGFTPGISVFNTILDERVFVGAGLYKPNFRNIYAWNVGDGESLLAGRVAVTPIYSDHGRCLVHLGLGYSHATADDGVLRYRARSALRNGPAALHPVLAIIQMQGHNQNVFVPEFAMNSGPFNVSAEYYAATTGMRNGQAFQVVGNQTAGLPAGGRGTLFYQGGYVTVGYFLTGEHRGYNMKTKAWDRQYVNETAFLVDGEDGVAFGRGAVELLARYSWLDLSDKGINGGNLHSSTLGVNWYLNPNAKIQFNYEIGHRDATQYSAGIIAVGGVNSRDGVYQGVGTRLAFDF